MKVALKVVGKFGSVRSLVEADGDSLPSANGSNSSAVVSEIDKASLEVVHIKIRQLVFYLTNTESERATVSEIQLCFLLSTSSQPNQAQYFESLSPSGNLHFQSIHFFLDGIRFRLVFEF